MSTIAQMVNELSILQIMEYLYYKRVMKEFLYYTDMTFLKLKLIFCRSGSWYVYIEWP